jgi:Undecaprenyl-phosphate galactose phosphotransferase WbaP
VSPDSLHRQEAGLPGTLPTPGGAPTRLQFDTPAPIVGGRPMPRTLRDAACVLVLAVTDISASFVAVAAAAWVLEYVDHWIRLQPLTTLSIIDAAQLIAAVVVGGFFVRGLYLRREPFWEKLRLTCATLVQSLVLCLVVLFLTRIVETVPRSFAVVCGLMVLTLVPPARMLALRGLRAAGVWNLRVAIVGHPDHLKSAAEDLSSDSGLGYRIIALVDASSANLHLPPRLDEVVIVARGLHPDDVTRLFSAVHRTASSVSLIPDFGALPFARGATRFLFDRQRLLVTSRNLLKDPASRALKRIFDLLVATLLLVPAIPIMLVCALAVRLTSRGPALYYQPRVGRHGRPFRCLKFRTMYGDAESRLANILKNDPARQEEWERFQKLRDDPRVTLAGKFLRKTSLDELPQLLNVIAGSMSLVGPRPLPEYHYRKFEEPYASDYLEVKPGITGLWQVSGRADADVNRMALLNSWYSRNWSLWLDMNLLVRTIPAVLWSRGAY